MLLPGPRRHGFADPEVAKKLNITDAQKDEIKTITDESNGGDAGAFAWLSKTTAKVR